MASQLFPDNGSRLVLDQNGNQISNGLIVYYLDAAGQHRAPVYVDRGSDQPDDDDALESSQTRLDAFGCQVNFRGPTDGTDTLYGTVDGGPIFRVSAVPEPRLRALEEAVADAATAGDLSGIAEAAAADATAKVGAAQSAAAADATSKASAAQAAAIAAASTDASAKAAAALAAATAEVSRVAELAAAMSARFPRNRRTAIGRRGTTYDLYQLVNDSVWWRSSIEAQTVPDTATPLHLMAAQALITPAAYVLASGGTVVDAGGTWTLGNNVDALGGSYWQSIVAGATKTWTSPAGATALGLNGVTTTNGSLAKVSIDNDATRANLLPTAQAVVDSGAYPASILVANGGPCQPTDRVYSSYATSHSWSTSTMIATDLTPGAHTVVFTSLGVTPVGQGSANRAYISDFLYNNGQTLGAGGTTTVVEPVSSTISAISAWEYAILCQPTGASAPWTIGNTHGGDTELSWQVYINGTATTLTDNTITLLTDTAEIRRTSRLTHIYLAGGATKVADSEVWYRLTRDGIQIDNTITWAVGAVITADFIMLPMPGVLSTTGGQRFGCGDHTANATGVLTFTGGNGVLDVPKSKSPAGWMWQQNGRLAAGVWCANPGSYLQTGSPTYFQDRNGDVLKLYVARSYAPFQSETVTAGSTRTAKARYVFRVATGIDSLMRA